MNEAPDPLVAELAALRPKAISPQLRSRIAEQLGDDLARSAGERKVNRSFIGRVPWLAVVGCVVAMGLLLLVWRWPGWHTRHEQPAPNPHPRQNEIVHDTPAPNPDKSVAGSRAGREPDTLGSPVFTWPVDETQPMKGYASIPADLLD